MKSFRGVTLTSFTIKQLLISNGQKIQLIILRPLFLHQDWLEANIVATPVRPFSLEEPSSLFLVPYQPLPVKKSGFKRQLSTAMAMDGQTTTEINGILTLEMLQPRTQTGLLHFWWSMKLYCIKNSSIVYHRAIKRVIRYNMANRKWLWIWNWWMNGKS